MIIRCYFNGFHNGTLFSSPETSSWRTIKRFPTTTPQSATKSLQWRHNGHDSVSNHQPPDCLLNRLFRRGPVNSPHKWPVTRKMFPFDDVIMCIRFTYVWGMCCECVSDVLPLSCGPFTNRNQLRRDMWLLIHAITSITIEINAWVSNYMPMMTT